MPTLPTLSDGAAAELPAAAGGRVRVHVSNADASLRRVESSVRGAAARAGMRAAALTVVNIGASPVESRDLSFSATRADGRGIPLDTLVEWERLRPAERLEGWLVLWAPAAANVTVHCRSASDATAAWRLGVAA